MTWPFALLGLAKKALTALTDFARAYPLQFACIALLALSGWLWHGKREAIEQRDVAVAGRKADRTAYVDAQAEAAAKAIAALQAAETRYTNLAKDADNEQRVELADARTAADRYIAANRVRRCEAAGSPRGGPVAAPESPDTGVPESLPADSLVAISDDDLHKCTAATVYAIGARAWALSLEGK